MKKTKFHRAVHNHVEEIDGVYDPEYPGLVIAKTTAEKPAWNTYSIYHEGTGRYVMELTFAKRKEAEEALRLIGPLADWTKTAATLLSLKLLIGVRLIEQQLMAKRLEVTA